MHKLGRAGGAALDVHHILEGGIGGAEPAQQQVRIADNRGQKIVEIVRDAAREFAHGLQFLALHRFLAAKRRRPARDCGDDEIAAIRGRERGRARMLRPSLPLSVACSSATPSLKAPCSPRLAIRSRTFCEDASATSSASDLPQSSVLAPASPRCS